MNLSFMSSMISEAVAETVAQVRLLKSGSPEFDGKYRDLMVLRHSLKEVQKQIIEMDAKWLKREKGANQ